MQLSQPARALLVETVADGSTRATRRVWAIDADWVRVGDAGLFYRRRHAEELERAGLLDYRPAVRGRYIDGWRLTPAGVALAK